MRRRGSRLRSIGFIPQDFLVSEWKLDEVSGNIFYDSKGSLNGSVTDASTYTSTGITAKTGTSFNFTGKAVVSVPGNTNFEVYDGVENKPFSFSLWHEQPVSTGYSLEFFINLNNSGVKIVLIAIVANNLRSEIYTQSGDILISIFNSYDKFLKNNIVFSFDPNRAEHSLFFINGIKVNQNVTGVVSPVKIGNTALAIGSSDSGKLDEIKYYKRALTLEDSINIYNAEK